MAHLRIDKAKPGDLLLYHGVGLLSRLISVKTWSSVTHAEVYIGFGAHAPLTVGARPSYGVRTYFFQPEGLVYILRPQARLNLTAALRYHGRCKGQAYDWLGLLRFFTIGHQSTDKQFCSEYVTRFYRAGGFEPFTRGVDADLVAPGQFLYSPRFTPV